MPIDRDEVVRLTEEYGGAWAINHTRRILHLVSLIAEDREYDRDAVWLAAHLHDWGAYPRWAKSGIDHAARSAEVGADYLRAAGCPGPTLGLAVECIRTHHSADPARSLEAILLSDADGLDFLGAIGVMRDFSKSPREMRKGFEAARRRMSEVPARLILNQSRQLAAGRLKEMNEILGAFERSSFGLF